VAFEETAADLAKNVASLGFDVHGLIDQKKMVIDHIHIDPAEIEETGEYDLEGLFIRLGFAIDAIGAKRVALDTVEVLFSGFMDHAVLRAELRRLFSWLKDRGVTAIITGEAGETTFSRYGLEEYVADCVIALDNRVVNQIATRRLRIVKYRGSAHGMDEYPFLIDADGFRSSRSPRWGWTTRYRPSGYRAVLRTSMPCWAAATTGGAPFWSPASPGQARPAWRRVLRTSPAPGVNAASISPLRNPRASWSAICAPSASTWDRG